MKKPPEPVDPTGVSDMMFKFPDDLQTSLIRILAGVLAGFAVAWIYSITVGRNRRNNQGLPTTIVLLAALIAVVTQVIGESQARAFGLVGALSIVRFRAVVEDTGDTAFVIFAVVVGMAMGADKIWLGMIALPIVGFTAWIMSLFQKSPAAVVAKPCQLVIRIATGLEPETLVGKLLNELLAERTVTRVETAQKGASVELTYAVKPRESTSSFTLISELSKIEGVQGVEWKNGS